ALAGQVADTHRPFGELDQGVGLPPGVAAWVWLAVLSRAGCGQRVERGADSVPAFGVEPAGDADSAGAVGCGVELPVFLGGSVVAFELPAEDLLAVVGVDDGDDLSAELAQDPRVILLRPVEQCSFGRRGRPWRRLVRQLGDRSGDDLGVLGADPTFG